MSPESGKAFWASRMQNRFRIYNMVSEQRCMISALNKVEALANLGWGKDVCMIVSMGKMKQLPFVIWYVTPDKIHRKDIKNE